MIETNVFCRICGNCHNKAHKIIDNGNGTYCCGYCGFEYSSLDDIFNEPEITYVDFNEYCKLEDLKKEGRFKTRLVRFLIDAEVVERGIIVILQSFIVY